MTLPRDFGCINATPICGRSAGSSRRPLTIAPKPAVYGRISRPSDVVSTASRGGSPCVSDQSTGSTHSGWSAVVVPTGRSATTGIPTVRQHVLRANTGEHQQVRGSDCTGAQR